MAEAGAAVPVAATFALVGDALGLVVGFAFAPVGMVAGPMLGAGFGAAVITAHAVAIAAAPGAAVGAFNAFNAPSRVVGE